MRSCLFCALILLGSASPTWAQSVALQGMLGSKALLIIDGGAPRTLGPGQSAQGVKVLSTSGDQAVVEVGGQRRTLRVGEAPANVGGARMDGGGDKVVLTADSRGHFFSEGSINNRPAQFMVDTGASVVALGEGEAQRLGLDYKKGRRVQVATANGAAPAYLFKIDQLRLGDVTVYGVDAVVSPSAMPAILLGNSFLNRFNMRRDGDQMTLQRR